MSALAAPAPLRFAPLPLWRIAETFLRTLFVLFGAPEEIAASHTLSRKLALQMRAWLMAGEALLRRLLLVEAAAWAKRDAGPAPQTRTPRAPRERKLMAFTADTPDAWRVRFACIPAAHSAGRPRARPQRRLQRWRVPKRFHDAWPLAERLEALRRVFNDPSAFARRLARRLRKRPRLTRTILHDPPGAADLVGKSDFYAAHDAAEAAWRNNTS